MKCICFLLGGLTIASAIRVPSSWNEELRNNPKTRYKNIHPLRTNRNTNSLQVLNPPGTFHRKPNFLLKPRKNVPDTKYFPKPITKSTPYRTINEFQQNFPSSSRSIQPEVKPIVNYAVVEKEAKNQWFPMTENLPSFTTIIPPVDSYQIFTKPTSTKLSNFTPKPNLANVTPFQNMHQTSINPSNHKSQVTPGQNRLHDFISNPLDFRVFEQTSADSSQKSPQEKTTSYESSSTSFPPQNFDRVFMVPTNHQLQSKATKQVTVGNLSPSQNFDQTFNIPFNHEFVSSSNIHDHNPKSHLLKNYRDDRTHEPIEFDPFLDSEDTPVILRDESEKAPISTHEYPADIPTKPIYPGEGLWAIRGLKHKPFISKQEYESLEKDAKIQDGYDTFIGGEKMFNQQYQKFDKHLDAFPKKHNLDSLGDQKQQRQQEPNTNKEEAETIRDEEAMEPDKGNDEKDDEHEDEFVPMKLYAQVRHSEDIEHLPNNDEENGRLREAIKESKIQTVYTEEGYEDNAYDHEGHEKEAENKEEFEELERGQEKTDEKRVPHKKYNLHLVPNIESTRYSSGFKLPTDEEIEDYKKMQLGLEGDSDIAGSQYEESSIFNNANTRHKSPKDSQAHNSKKIKKSNNFMSTKEIKTMTTKEKDDGDTETEISSRIKVIMQPNNTAKAHKFIKIIPKVYKNRKKVPSSSNSGDVRIAKVNPIITGEMTEPNKHGIYIEEIITTSTKPLLTTLPTTEFPDILSEEIPITTLPTTAIPRSGKKSIQDKLANIDSIPSRIDIRSREKRFVNDFPNIQIDNGFISKINHELIKVQVNTKAKYPYYENFKRIDLNENSPLRYSEDLNSMPMKSEGKMSFYEQADSRIECPEIESTVEPIPERVKNVGEEQSDDAYDNENEEDESEEQKESDGKKNVAVAEQPKGPRLNRLGDKIDCLKARYFGENPLDSPFFGEDIIGPVKPIFKISVGVKSDTEIDNPDNVSAETQNPTSFLAENEINNDVDKNKQIDMIRKFKDLNGIDENAPKLIDSNSSVNMGSLDEIKYNNSIQVKDVKKVPDASIEFDDEKLGLNVLNDISENMKSLNQSQNNNSTQIPPTIGTKATISLLTTPEYTIDLKPKHIYDQIDLLNYLPEEERSTTNNESDTNLIPAIPSTELKLMADDETADRDTNMRQPKSHEAEEQDNLTYDSSFMIHNLPDAEALRKRRKFRIRRKRPGFQILDVNKFLPTPYTVQKGHLIPTRNSISEGFQIFDVNKFLPTTPYPIIADLIASSTVLPKYKIVSEVFYKDDIKPNEQLNVFTDILNNIRNSSGNIATDSSQESSHISTNSNAPEEFDRTINSIKYDKDTYLTAYNDQQVDDKYYPSIVTTLSTTTSTHEPQINRGSIRFSTELNRIKPSTTHRPIQSNDKKLKLYAALLEAKLRQSNELQNNSPGIASTTPSQRDSYSENYRTKVEGMNPPGSQHYKTLFHPKRDNNMHLSIPGYKGTSHVNKYIVMGMKPPPRQRVLIYSDFLLNNNHLRQRKGFLRRSRRSTNRAAYAEVSRNNARLPQDDEIGNIDDEDDYVPHRPKNYFYDEKTGKIIYNNVKRPQDGDEDSEVEYIEITEPPRPKTTSKPKQNPIFATATPPPNGQSYVDFVKKLKSAADYKFIPDPTTTEKNTVQSTEQVTMLSPISTTPPEFLNILAKIRETSDYRIIKDPIDNKSTTTETPEEVFEEENEEETAPTHLGNSPGGEQHSITNDFQIFDISDYIPKLKNYLPRTSIDYSKYKTIERPAPKDHPESEEDSEEPEMSSAVQTQDISDNSTNIEKIVVEEKDVEDIPVTTTTTTTTPIKFNTTPHSRRRRPTTLRSSRTSTRPTSTKSPTLATAESQVVRNEKPRRNYRRRPTRIKSTTERLLGDDIDETTKILRRRKIDANTSSKKANDEKNGKIETDDNSNDNIASDISNPVINHPEKSVEVFQEYNQENEHGGNYRKEDVIEPQKKLLEPVIEASRKSKDVEIISEFDKAKRHGGNYKGENEDYVELKEEDKLSDPMGDSELEVLDSGRFKSEDQPLTIQLLPKYKDEMTEKKREVEPDHDERSIQNSNMHRKRNRITRKYKKYPKNHGAVGRLTDVVPKPESFYSDPYLPRSINLLMIAQPVKIDDSSSEDTDEVDIAVSTKKPSFIKDPSERLYYYAPV